MTTDSSNPDRGSEHGGRRLVGNEPAAGDRAVSANEANGAFDDARAMHAAALARLAAGDIRDAAEKAWCATKRATDGLIVARTGSEPAKSPITTRELNRLAGQDPGVERLVDRYYVAQGSLHGDCFYLGFCEPIDRTELRIRGISDYIRDAERLAASGVDAPSS